ncbi:ComEA family DNA-binding protein [Candidatus Oscillochloris fontis]|uniref:ComEA family DNA-binding protein n=1 Tax=Candidatus Oscillochloris fontis TaxID=2496868 RepID=UPI003B83559C
MNINTADLQTLIDLPGINESLARRIIAHREEKGPFASVDQLTDISGIGHKNINIFRDLITV